MSSSEVLAFIREPMAEVEEKLCDSIDTGLPLLKEASEHLIKAGGKRLRPAFVLLAGSLFTPEVKKLIPMAAAVELVHMATLVHDDVIDNSPLRRGRQTVKAVFGNRMSIYSGDYLFAKALALIASYRRNDVAGLVAEASVKICLGEINQMRTCFQVEQGFKQYIRRIELKTALLLALSCELGALIAGASTEMVRKVRNYGRNLGIAFQITDDVLDYTADEKVLGKPTGSDIRQGIITLPAIFALRYSPDREEIRRLLDSRSLSQMQAERCIELVNNSGGIEYSLNVAARYVNKAKRQLESFPDSMAKQAMLEVADFICFRSF